MSRNMSFLLLNKREEEIAKLISFLSEKTKSFTNPKMIVIGGYALRAFVPFSRYSRDCDFALKKGLETIRSITPKWMRIETFEQKDDYAYMRCSKVFEINKRKAKFGIDFMEGQIRGRENEAFILDDKFLNNSKKVEIQIYNIKCKIYVPSYTDFLLIKIMSARRSDTRDIATMVWKNGIPKNIIKRLDALNDATVFTRNLKHRIIPDIKNKFFLNSWKGMFATNEFTNVDQMKIAKELENLIDER